MTAVAWAELDHLARRIAKRFSLRAFELRPLPPHDKRFSCWGDCDIHTTARPLIRLRVHRLNSKRPLARSTVERVLAHELAHLREPGENAAHRALAAAIRDYLA